MTFRTKAAHSVRLALVASLAACSGDWFAPGSGPQRTEATGQTNSALSTTSVTFGGDEFRTGWYSDEAALAPSTVSGSSFGALFTTNISGQVYAQPLVSMGTLFIATENNVIYGLDPATGRQLWSRTLATAVASRDLPAQCSNIAPTVGVTGTPVIDSSTNIAYFLSKAYVSGSSGAIGYFAHGVNVSTGAEVAGFPVSIQGSAANDTTQTFNAQAQLQRPGLLLMNGVVYAGFGSHCDQAPAVGWIVGVSTSGQIKTLWTTEAGPNKTALGSVWAPGALASDGSGQIVFVTGNGVSSPVTTGPGTSPPAALPESAVRLAVQTDGSLKATDYFSPFTEATLDTNDWDFGSSSPLLLPSTFGTSAIPHLMVTGSKGGILYLLNRDSLGGRGQGTVGTDGGAGGDAVLAEFGPFPPNTLGAVGMWTNPSTWPGDGGYVYTVEASEGGSPAYLRAFKSGLDGSGKPTLVPSGRSNTTFGFSSGSPMVTSNGSTAGSALVWVEYAVGAGSSGAELRAYDAVPVGGVLNERWHASIGQISNFAAPGIAGGRVYVGTRDGRVLGFGVMGGGSDAGADASADASGDAAKDTGADAAKDASPETGSDAATDASSSAGCATGATVLSPAACSSMPSFNTTGAVCVKIKVATVNGWNASNVQGRTATAKGSTTQGPITPTNGSIPNQPGLSAGSDGFVYFNFTAGSVNYTSMACW
jgi:PQQ-like domain